MFRILSLALLVGVLGAGLVIDQAEAKRLGGGMNLGRQRAVTPPPAPTRQMASKPTQGSPGAAPVSRGSRWLGPLAGLAAGGLLAALLFGDSFQGLQILDFLLLGVVAYALFALFRRSRQRGRETVYGRRPAYGGPAGGSPPEQHFGGGGASVARPAGPVTPDWFDRDRFLGDAQAHFLTLQLAWDEGDMERIREFCTPGLFGELSRQRAGLGERQNTDVQDLQVQLADFADEGEQVVASVMFRGMVSESVGEAPRPFAELWHVERSSRGEAAPWLVAGIQQL
jgi:predicted lipid-binding transport protein (Tim44 family)